MLARRDLLWALSLGALLRIGMMALVDFRLDSGDTVGYQAFARNLLEHGVYSMSFAPPIEPSVYRPPAFPLLLAALRAVFGPSIIAIQLVQTVLGLAAAWLLAEGVARIEPSAARASLWIAALSPFDAVYAVAILSEGLCSFLLTVAFVLPFLLKSPLRFVAMGAALAGAILTRDVYMLLAPGVAAALLLFPKLTPLGEAPWPKRLAAAALFTAGTVAVIAPWTARNYSVMHAFIPVSKGTLGATLWIGTWEIEPSWAQQGNFRKGWVPPPAARNDAERDETRAILLQPSAIDRDNGLRELALRRIKDEPFQVLGRWIIRAPRLWVATRFDTFAFRPALLGRHQPLWWALKIALLGLDVALCATALLGIVLAARSRSKLLWFFLPVLYTAALLFPMHNTEPRYSQPVLVFLYVLASLGVVFVATKIRAWKRAP